MGNLNADRNLLFGILAVQLDFVSRDALVEAMNGWVLEKSKPLGEIMREQGKLKQDRLQLLNALVIEHLKQHGGLAENSLRALSSMDGVREDLKRIGDHDLETSLTQVSSTRDTVDPNATLASTVGERTSSGTRFHILRPHARGGLGQVSVALDEELNREVALKELQEHVADDPHCRLRFSLEAEITGGLEHPGVVPVYGLGQYADGRPYYAMRLIRGDSLKDAIEQFHSKTLARSGRGMGEGEAAVEFRKLLGRFIDVCNAIEYAHSRGVLHRDLKPGNIMLGRYGETLVVDWGLAKPVGRPETYGTSPEETLAPSSGSGSAPTQAGKAIGTPAYMSPEQAAGRIDELGPATDVYSLGATLYTLLTGQAPFVDADLAMTLRKVQNGDFPAPRQLNPAVAPALEAICLKAMARDPARRYASPSELAEDIEHWLANEPVSAYPEPVVVRVRRWVRRHETVVGVAAAAVLVAGIGLVVHGRVISERNEKLSEAMFAARSARDDAERQRGRAEIAARDARTEAARAMEVSTFLQGMFEAGDPVGMRGWKFGLTQKSRQNLTAREVLEQGEATVRDKLKEQPIVQASLLNAIGNCYFNLALKEKAAPLLEEALALRRQYLSEDHPDFADSLLNVGWLRHELGNYDEAEQLYRQALQLRRRNLGDDDLTVADTMFYLAWLLADTGGFDESERLFRRVIELRINKLGKNDRQVAVALVGLAGLFIQKGDDDLKILPIVQQAQAIFLKQPGDRAFADATVAFQMGIMQDRMFNNLEAAEKEFRKARALAIQALGEEHPYVAFGSNELASILRKQKRYDEAETLLREILATCGRILSADHPKMVLVLEGLAYTVELKGDLPAAKELYMECTRLQERWLSSHSATLTTQLNLAGFHRSLTGICRKLGQVGEAELHCRKAIEILNSHKSETAARLALANSFKLLGDIKLEMHDREQSLANYTQTLTIYSEISEASPNNRDVKAMLAQSYANLAGVSLHSGQVTSALNYCRKERSVLAILVDSRAGDYKAQLDLALANFRLGEIAIQLGHANEACTYYAQAEAQLNRLPEMNDTEVIRQKNLAKCRNRLALAYESIQQFEVAEEWFTKELEIVEQLDANGQLHSNESGWLSKAKTHVSISRHARSAITDLDFAMSQPQPEAAALLAIRAGVLAEQGRHAEAMATVESLRALAPDSPRHLYDVARCLSLCSRAVLLARMKSIPLPDGETNIDDLLTPMDRAAGEQYCDKAIDSLFAALDAGLTGVHALTDPDLIPIRQHPRHREVVERLQSVPSNQNRAATGSGDME